MDRLDTATGIDQQALVRCCYSHSRVVSDGRLTCGALSKYYAQLVLGRGEVVGAGVSQ